MDQLLVLAPGDPNPNTNLSPPLLARARGPISQHRLSPTSAGTRPGPIVLQTPRTASSESHDVPTDRPHQSHADALRRPRLAQNKHRAGERRSISKAPATRHHGDVVSGGLDICGRHTPPHTTTPNDAAASGGRHKLYPAGGRWRSRRGVPAIPRIGALPARFASCEEARRRGPTQRKQGAGTVGVQRCALLRAGAEAPEG